MAQLKDEKALVRFLQCSSILEGKVANAYKHLAERVENTTVKSLLRYIANDTSKHSEILGDIGNTIAGFEASIEDYERTCGKVWKTLIMDSMRELSKRNTITKEELASHIDAMKNLESYFAEEYLTALHTKVVKFIAQQQDIGLHDCSVILEWIIEDERRHEQTLMMIKDISTEQREPSLTKQTTINHSLLEHKQLARRAENNLKIVNSQRNPRKPTGKALGCNRRKPTWTRGNH